ncbi:MAG: hypothetical protein IJT14_00890 [Rickettsiales bacterium]|nr:hypothetical protein [Rickettsiales bacterium]
MSIASLPKNKDFRTEAQSTIRFDFMKQGLGGKENSIIIDRYVKMFDKHFLNFITQRQQRDLAILQCVMQFLLQQTECNKKNFQHLQMSSAFTIESKHIQIDNSIVPIDWQLNVLHLEQEMSTMKSIHSFIQNIVFKHATDCDKKAAKNLASIDAKIEKIKKLTDEAMIDRITHGDKCMEYIQDKLHPLKKYEEILENIGMNTNLEEDYIHLKEYLNKVKDLDFSKPC